MAHIPATAGSLGVKRLWPSLQAMYLAEIGTGRVVAHAELTGSRVLAADEAISQYLIEDRERLLYPKPHLWEMRNVVALEEAWVLSKQARHGCVQWIPERRWSTEDPKPAPRRKSCLTPWPKRPPRKPREDGQLLALPKSLGESSSRPKKGKRGGTKIKQNAPADESKIHGAAGSSRESLFPGLSQRISAGRNLQRLRHLQSMSLFHERVDFGGVHKVRAGLCAVAGQDIVYIVGTFERNHVAMADVLPLRSEAGQDCGATDTGRELHAFRRDIRTCRQQELSEVGLRSVRLLKRNLKRGRLLFREVEQRTVPVCTDAVEVSRCLRWLGQGGDGDGGSLVEDGCLGVVPQAAVAHRAKLIGGKYHYVCVACLSV